MYFCNFATRNLLSIKNKINMANNYKSRFVAMAASAFLAVGATFAQSLNIYGVKNTMRYDDGEDTKYTYLGWNAATGKAEFAGDVGLWSLDVTGNTVKSNLVHYDNLMYGNSGSFYMNGIIYTIMSHEDPDSDVSGEMEFVVRKWDAKTYEKLSEVRYPKSANLESRGLAYNPKDGKVYGLFYLTDVKLPVPDEELSDEDIQDGLTTDAGYAICTIDLETMTITQITPGIYYENYVTLACSPEGRLFAMTSSGMLVEFDPATGLYKAKTIINDEGDPEEVSAYPHSGVVSQFKRQAACFDHKTGKMYWNGYVNSGKGINDWGSWGPLSDKEWRTNGKYDTALYEVDIETGLATKISLIPNRIAFSCLWVDGADGTDVVPADPEVTAVNAVESVNDADVQIFNAAGQMISADEANAKGIYIIKKGNSVKKVMKK